MRTLLLSFLLATCVVATSQTIMFDDFSYWSVDDPSISTFNKWSIVKGVNGPPTNAVYKEENIKFITDPDDSSNKIITLSTTVDGGSKATTHSRIETSGFEYFEGTYAARVYFSNVPNTYGDGNIQTFYTIVSYLLAGDGSKYSELDFEYMASDKWGTSSNNEVMYVTAWNRYIASPWQSWSAHKAEIKSFEGWHDCLVQVTDGTNVKFWIDGVYIGSVATASKDGSSVYPRSKMQVAFANWVWNNKIGSSTEKRTCTMKADWVIYYKDEAKSPSEIASLVADFRSRGVARRNLEGVEKPLSTGNSLKDESIKLIAYPNPNNKGLYNLNIRIARGKVLDSLGQNVLEVFDSKTVDLSGFKSGVYFLLSNEATIKLIK